MTGTLIVCNGTPNPRYRGHTGVVLRRLLDVDTNEVLVEVRWDNPPPVDGLTMQVMRAEHILSRYTTTDLTIEEEP